MESMKSIGKRMDGAKADYDKAMNQLYEGKRKPGVKRWKILKKLGAKTIKSTSRKERNKKKPEARTSGLI